MTQYYVVYLDCEHPEVSASNYEMEQVNSALMLGIVKDRALRQVEARYYHEFLVGLIEGDETPIEQLQDRSERLRRKVHDAYQLVVFQDADLAKTGFEGIIDRLKDERNQLLQDVLYCVKDDKIILFCPVEVTEDRDSIKELASVVTSFTCKKGLRFGVSRVRKVTSMKSAYEEALSCLSFVGLTSETLIFYSDMGLLRLLAQNPDSLNIGFISDFYEEVMGPIAAHDKAGKVNLRETLSEYFLNDGSILRTARSLGIHENTLRIRMRKIEDLSGRSFRRTRGWVELYLATLINASISPSSTTRSM